MHDDPSPERDSPTKSLRFRFGLRALFVVVTLMCIWMGYRSARQRSVHVITARYQAVLDAFMKTFDNDPGTTWSNSNAVPADGISTKELEPYGTNFRRISVFWVVEPSKAVLKPLFLNSHRSQMNPSPVVLASRLVQHYGRGLPELGLQQDTMGGEGGPEGECGNARSIWISPNADLSVVIEAKVLPESQNAEVSILVIDSQQLHLW